MVTRCLGLLLRISPKSLLLEFVFVQPNNCFITERSSSSIISPNGQHSLLLFLFTVQFREIMLLVLSFKRKRMLGLINNSLFGLAVMASS